jgi:hypothetical protein
VEPLFNHSHSDSMMAKLEKTWASSLNKSMHVRFTARNLFCSRLSKGLVASALLDGNELSVSAMTKSCIKNHNTRFDKLSAEDHMTLAYEATGVRHQRTLAMVAATAQAHNALQAAKANCLNTNEKPLESRCEHASMSSARFINPYRQQRNETIYIGYLCLAVICTYIVYIYLINV